MARATRNTTNGVVEKRADIENELPPDASPLSAKASKAALNKKRKRTSEVEPADIPSSKQSRSDEGEGTPSLDDKLGAQDAHDSRYPAFAGDMPLNDDDARKILDILDVADEQGLLDRVFPLVDVLGVETPVPSSSKSPTDSYSLRMLLQESSQHPLRVLKSAIKELFPISSQPRSRASPPAQQQRRFCELALQLIDQASKHILDGLALSYDVVLPEQKPKTDEEEDEVSPNTRRKYALVQRLPTGDLWTSLNSDNIGSDLKPLVDAETGYAELVAVLPSASSSKPPPTFGDLHADKVITTRPKPLPSQRFSCGSFLDYGPTASFAPTFDGDLGDIGYNAVTSVLWRRHEKGKAREKARILGDRLRQKLAQQSAEAMEVDGVEEIDPADDKGEERAQAKEMRKALVQKVFGGEDALEVLAVFDALEQEENMAELVQRSGEAIYRLSHVQEERFRRANARGLIDADEKELAQKISDSLALLASLRPRKEGDSNSTLIPPVSALRKLQRQLPREASPGWHGTLSEDKGFALRDDTTLNVQNVPAQTPAAAPTTPGIPPATSSFPMPFTNFNQNYRTTYGAQSNTPVAQRTPSSFNPSSMTPQQQQYMQWLNQGSVSQAGTPGRINTPQQQQSTNFYPYGAQAGAGNTSTPTRAVANTLVGKLQAAVGMSAGGAANGGLALPAHMRQQASTSSPLAYGNFP